MTMETERLILRPIHMQDAQDFFEYAQNPHVGPNAGWQPHESKRHTQKIIRAVFLGNSLVFGVVLKDSGKLIGTAGFAQDLKRPGMDIKMLGYGIGEPYWGQGYIPEAARTLLHYSFEVLTLPIVTAYCYPHNHRSRRVLEKCGFSYEGKLRMAERLYDGRIMDNLCFSQTLAEYQASAACSP